MSYIACANYSLQKTMLTTNALKFACNASLLSNRFGVGKRTVATSIAIRNAIASRGFRKRFLDIRRYSEKAETEVKPVGFVEKVKMFWRGPNFKYWVIGVSAFSTWLSYYTLNSYKSTRINIKLPLAMPNHLIIERKDELDTILDELSDSRPIGNKIKCVALCGPTGSGKSVLSNWVTEKLIREIDWNPVGLPKSHISVFLNGENLKSFLLSLQGFAAGMKIRPSEIKDRANESGGLHDCIVHCKTILYLLKEKLEKHPNWVIVVDNLQQGTSEEVVHILEDVVINEESAKTWSKGTLIMTSDGFNLGQTQDIKQLKMDPRLSESDAITLLKEIVNIKDSSFEKSTAAKALLGRISYHPMATVCAGILLRDRLKLKEISSIDGVLREFLKDITRKGVEVMRNSPLGPKDGVSESLIMAETIIAMTLKMYMGANPHLSSSVDLLSACAPRTPIPAAFIRRYLSHPSLNLPAIEKPISSYGNLQQMFKPTPEAKDDELDPKGKAWSNKSITEYVTNIEQWFSELWQALKEVYNFYYGKLPEEEIDHSIKVLHDCELLLSSKLQPGDMESYALHPLTYAAARQHFLARSVPKIEDEFLNDDETKFNNQPWFKKMSKYDPKISLFQHRNGELKSAVATELSASLVNSYNNALINVSSVFLEPSLEYEESDFRFLKDEDKIKYLQSHLDRIIRTLGEEVRVSKQTVTGKTSTKYLSVHGEYLQKNQPVESTGVGARISGLLTSAKIAANFESDIDKAIVEVELALELIKENDSGNSLEIASILCQLAALYNSKEDYVNAKNQLEEAIDIYESQRRKDGEYKRPLELGKALGALGVIRGALGERTKSKELIERGLMLQQSGAPDLSDEAQSKHFGAEFASSLTDLGHAYVSLGMPLYGKKILDLSLMAHKNIHGEKHPEVVRTLTVLSIAHLMQGHNEESRRLRKEAGKVQSQINALPMY